MERNTTMAGTEHNPLGLGAAPYDNSGLRSRLGDYVAQPRSIEAELRAVMQERETVAVSTKRRKSRWD
jgi:hypothetical protein